MKARTALFCILVGGLVSSTGHAESKVVNKAKSVQVAIELKVKSLFKRDTMSVARIKAARDHLKEQRKYIAGRKGIRKKLTNNLVDLIDGQEHVNVMESLLNCLEKPEGTNSFSYNAIAFDKMRDLKELRELLSDLSSAPLEEKCSTSIQELNDHFGGSKGIQDTVKYDKSKPNPGLVNLSYMAIYSEQDIRHLFQYYVAHLNRVIDLHSNFSTHVSDLKRIATVRLQSHNIEIPQEILDGLERQRKLALYKVQTLSENVLERGGENGEAPLYSFQRIKKLHVLVSFIAGTEQVDSFLDKKKPYDLEDSPMALELPDTFGYAATIKLMSENLGDYVPPADEDENVDLEHGMEQNISEILAFIDAAIDEANAQIKARR